MHRYTPPFSNNLSRAWPGRPPGSGRTPGLTCSRNGTALSATSTAGRWPFSPCATPAPTPTAWPANSATTSTSPAQIALLYSLPSLTLNPATDASTRAAYDALAGTGRKPGFLSENQLQAGQTGAVKLLVAADAAYVEPATAAGTGQIRRRRRPHRDGGQQLQVRHQRPPP